MLWCATCGKTFKLMGLLTTGTVWQLLDFHRSDSDERKEIQCEG